MKANAETPTKFLLKTAVCFLIAMGRMTEITPMILISDTEEMSNLEEYAMLTIIAKEACLELSNVQMELCSNQ